MKVVLVTPRFAVADAAGGEVSVGLLADALGARSVDVKVVAAHVDGKDARAVETPLTTPNIARESRGADVVHAYNMDALVETLKGARRAGAKAVATANSYWATCLWADMDYADGERCDGCSLAGIRRDYATRNPLTIGRKAPALVGRAVVRRRTAFLDRYDRVIALTNASRDRLVKGDVDPSRITVVPNMADPAWRTLAASGERAARAGWLFVGALKHTKGPHVAIEALAHAADARLTLVGDGPERKPLEALAARLGVAERVRFAGRLGQAELAREYS
ncbi:MAG: glycosyltransferase family 4 protein, partial [Thermoplasmatota archaeon]